MPLPYPIRPHTKPEASKKSTKVILNELTKTQIVDELTKRQDGLCAICVNNFNYKRKRILDCNKDKEPRGLLCYNCNVGLTMFKDDLDLLSRAIHYLLQFKVPIEEWEWQNNWWHNLPDVIQL